MKSFCTAKKIANKMKKKKLPLEGDKIFANDVTDKELISKMQK